MRSLAAASGIEVLCYSANGGRLCLSLLRSWTHRKNYILYNTSITNTVRIFLWLFSQFFISLVSPRYTNFWYTFLWRGASITIHKITFFSLPARLVSRPLVMRFGHVSIWWFAPHAQIGFLLSQWFHFTSNFQDFKLKMISTTGSALICNTQ